MKRQLARLSLGLLGLTALASGFLTVRSLLTADLISWGRHDFFSEGPAFYSGGRLESSLGGVVIGHRYVEYWGLAGWLGNEGFEWQSFEPDVYPYTEETADGFFDPHVRGAGFQLAVHSDRGDGLRHTEWFVTVPLPLIAVATGLWPAVRTYRWAREHRRRRRAVGGLCPACRYDLRASNDRCPECGLPITSS